MPDNSQVASATEAANGRSGLIAQLKKTLKITALMRFSIFEIVVVTLLTFRIPQIHEFFNLFTVQVLQSWFAVFAALVAGFTLWFCARVIFSIRVPGLLEGDGKDGTAWVRNQLPRILGALLPILLGIAIFTAGWRLKSADGSNPLLWQSTALISGGILLYIGFFLRRRVRLLRELFADKSQSRETGGEKVAKGMAAEDSPSEDTLFETWADLPWRVRFLFKFSYLALALLAIASIWQPIVLISAIGTVSFLIVAGALIVPFGTRLVHFSNASGLPVFWIIGIPLAFMLFAGSDKGHEIDPGATERAAASNSLSLDETEHADGNEKGNSLNDHLVAWANKTCNAHWEQARQQSTSTTRPSQCPLFLVAAEGGGIRAAYWTAFSLTALNDLTEGRFGRHVLALSTVSGGTLGGAVFAKTQNLEEVAPKSPDQGCVQSQQGFLRSQIADCFLRRDYLGPVVARLFFSDIPKWFLPFISSLPSRAQALEKGWEQGWHKTTGTNGFAHSFAKLETTDRGPGLILFNSTLVQTGERFIHSPQAISGFSDIFRAAMDGHTHLGSALPLSVAIHNSARFTYVSPAGAFRDHQGQQWQLVDGGYFENSGASTLLDLYDHLQDKGWPAPGSAPDSGSTESAIGLNGPVDLRFILISNAPTNEQRCMAHAPERQQRSAPEKPNTLYKDLTAPVLTLLHAREARGQTAVARLESRFDNCEVSGKRADRFHWFRLREREDAPELPLGWALSEPAIREMQGQLLCGDQLRDVDRESDEAIRDVTSLFGIADYPGAATALSKALGLDCDVIRYQELTDANSDGS